MTWSAGRDSSPSPIMGPITGSPEPSQSVRTRTMATVVALGLPSWPVRPSTVVRSTSTSTGFAPVS